MFSIQDPPIYKPFEPRSVPDGPTPRRVVLAAVLTPTAAPTALAVTLPLELPPRLVRLPLLDPLGNFDEPKPGFIHLLPELRIDCDLVARGPNDILQRRLEPVNRTIPAVDSKKGEGRRKEKGFRMSFGVPAHKARGGG